MLTFESRCIIAFFGRSNILMISGFVFELINLLAQSCARLSCCRSSWVVLVERTRTWAFFNYLDSSQKCNKQHFQPLMLYHLIIVWTSHIHKTPLQMWACSLLTLQLFCITIISCSLTSNEIILIFSSLFRSWLE